MNFAGGATEAYRSIDSAATYSFSNAPDIVIGLGYLPVGVFSINIEGCLKHSYKVIKEQCWITRLFLSVLQ